MPTKRLPQWEFIVLIAMLFASVAYSIDAMLPALSIIGQELSPTDPERATAAVGIFVLGMGIGTLLAGPLSDAFGRRAIILLGFLIYIASSMAASFAQSMDLLLLGRFAQGIAVAGPRIVALALVRDLYKGEQMAAISSYGLSIFVIVPAIAPLIGQTILQAFDWRAIFLSFVVFAIVIGSWFALRQPETLSKDKRIPLSVGALWSAGQECFSNRIFYLPLLSLTFAFSVLFAMVSSVQPIYAQAFDAEASFPMFFAASAALSIPANFINGRLVTRLGMRLLIKSALLFLLAATLVTLGIMAFGSMNVWVFFAWKVVLMFSVAFVLPNLTALALEPVGHIAGFAAAINGSLSTVGAALLAIPIALSFDGTPLALLASTLILFTLSFLVMIRLGPRPDIH